MIFRKRKFVSVVNLTFYAIAVYLGMSRVPTANAADIQLMDFNSQLRQAYISIHGEIAQGDFEKLVNIDFTIKRKFPGARIVSVGLRSPGGDLFEASKIAGIVKEERALTMVGANQVCASACVLIFAAGATKLVGETSRIIVHRASIASGRETEGSRAVTIEWADLLAELNVPPAIIGKLVTTPAGTSYTLTPSDLRLWGALVINQ